MASIFQQKERSLINIILWKKIIFKTNSSPWSPPKYFLAKEFPIPRSQHFHCFLPLLEFLPPLPSRCLPAPRIQASECSRQAQSLSQIHMRLREATKARFNFFYYHCQFLISGHPDCFAGLWSNDLFHCHFNDPVMLIVSFPIILILPPISLRQITWLSKSDPWRA